MRRVCWKLLLRLLCCRETSLCKQLLQVLILSLELAEEVLHLLIGKRLPSPRSRGFHVLQLNILVKLFLRALAGKWFIPLRGELRPNIELKWLVPLMLGLHSGMPNSTTLVGFYGFLRRGDFCVGNINCWLVRSGRGDQAAHRAALAALFLRGTSWQRGLWLWISHLT